MLVRSSTGFSGLAVVIVRGRGVSVCVTGGLEKVCKGGVI
jgi:hypothetical protein